MKETNRKIISNLNQSGITLIALVITIIVLLILAGVAISMLSGENGILNQAARAKQETDNKSIEERLKLVLTAGLTNQNHKINPNDLKEEIIREFGEESYNSETGKLKVGNKTYYIGNDGVVTEERDLKELKETEEKISFNAIGEDTNGDKIVIPANFNIASNSPLEVEQGIVIEDSSDNQYVWIPLFAKSTERDWGVDWGDETTGAKSKEENSDEYYKAIEDALKTYTQTYKNDSYSDVWYGDAKYGTYYYSDSSGNHFYTNGNMTKTEYDTLYHNMLKSVYKNGGFYIGRYEMGTAVVNSIEEAKANTRTSQKEYKIGTDNTTNEKPEGMPIPVSKANAVPYTHITQSQAQMLAEKVGEGADYSNVDTSIMFGIQWNAVCVFIEKCDTRNNASTKSDWLKNNTYGKLWGNYQNATYTMNRGFYSKDNGSTWTEQTTKSENEKWLYTTGATDQNSSLNIYDLGGNVLEWTLERFSVGSYPCASQGSFFGGDGYAFCHAWYYTYSSFYYGSSRIALSIS